MKVTDLIKKLQQLPQDAEVCIFDWRKNIYNSSEDQTGEGVHPHFEVSYETADVSKPFIALSFKNNDYKDDGMPDLDSAMPYNIVAEALNAD
jgi:hypothetical protein